MHIGIIGLGLIGGSIAKTIKKVHAQNSFIIGYDTHTEYAASAVDDGIVDQLATNMAEDFAGCNVIFICTPIDSIIPIAESLIPHVAKDCIITDIGSTKYEVVKTLSEKIESYDKNVYFVGGHPMTGSEKSGYYASNSYLFENAYYILTPSANTPDFILFILQKMIERLGAIPIILSPSYHDFATAVVSHFPHILASSLVHLVKECDGENHHLHTLAAGGFKDITRIASSDPTIWHNICLSNKEQLQNTLKRYLSILESFYDALDQHNDSEIYNFFSSARSYRNTFSEGINTDIIKSFTLYVDAQDEPGIIASIATLLSTRGINIKDLGIMNHREFECGVLRIAFATKTDMLEAHQILSRHNYTLYY